MHGNEKLHELLREIDPVEAAKTHANNVRRVIRALEIHHLTGENKTSLDEKSRAAPSLANIRIELSFAEKSLLDERINARADEMLAVGWIREAEELLNAGKRDAVVKTGAIGYAEIFSAIDGEISFEAAAEKIKSATRAYAKRQITWNKKCENSHRVDPNRPFGEIYSEVSKIISENRE